MKDKVNSIPKMTLFLTMGAVNKDIKSKRKFWTQPWS